MALETNTPQLTLEHMSLGSQERLEAGMRAGIARNRTASYQGYALCLFSGRRPTPDEVKNGIYFFEGTDPSYQFCGIHNINPNDYVELATESPFALAGREPNGSDVFNGKYHPAHPEGFVDTDGRAVLHHKFKRRQSFNARGNSIGHEAPDYVEVGGNGAAPTWAVMYPWGAKTRLEDFFAPDGGVSAANMATSFGRRDGKNITLCVRAIRPECNYYLTVGDYHDEPTANLVLHSGAQRGLDTQPRYIRIHRLKYVMPKAKTAPLTAQGV